MDKIDDDEFEQDDDFGRGTLSEFNRLNEDIDKTIGKKD